MLPGGAGVSAVGNKTGFQRPGAGVGAVGVRSLNSVLRDRVEGREGAQAEEVRAGRDEVDGQGQVVGRLNAVQDFVGVLGGLGSLGGDNGGNVVLLAIGLGLGGGVRVILGVVHRLVNNGVALEDAVVQVAVVGSGGRVGGAVPAVDEVVRGQRGAVAPVALTQVEGVGQAVLALLPGLGDAGGQVAFAVVGQQTDEGVDSQNSAVHGAVQVRVQTVGLGSDAEVQRAGVGIRRRRGFAAGRLGRGSLGAGLRAGAGGSAGTSAATAGQAEDHARGKHRCHELFHILSS